MTRLLIIATLLSLAGCAKFEAVQEAKLSANKKQILYHIAYGPHERNVLDIALPKNRNSQTPVVIFIHGGAWVAGDKSVFLQEMEMFANAGIACASLNYRYASEKDHVHHPDLPLDVEKAVSFIAAKASLWKVSENRFGLVGHSAGGHLALITAYRFHHQNRIKACASWAGPLDFLDSAQLSIQGVKEVLRTYTGKPLVSTADTLLYQSASPYWSIHSGTLPTLLIYGKKDEIIPCSCYLKMKSKLDSLAVPHEGLLLQDGKHVWTGSDLSLVRNTTLNWFIRTL
jgi:acetyl esterase/lipase